MFNDTPARKIDRAILCQNKAKKERKKERKKEKEKNEIKEKSKSNCIDNVVNYSSVSVPKSSDAPGYSVNMELHLSLMSAIVWQQFVVFNLLLAMYSESQSFTSLKMTPCNNHL